MKQSIKLLESDMIAKHHMTKEEQRVKSSLIKLLKQKQHSKYAARFALLDFNLVDAEKHPEFTAAVSFEEATVFLSTGFIGSGKKIFDQLDVLLRHELAHNLMMHQIRMMHKIQNKIFTDDAENAWEQYSFSAQLHKITNWLEDFEISNKRYTEADKKIVQNMFLNGQIIGGLITEEHRDNWKQLSLEDMYDALLKELIQINIDIRTDPYWQPLNNEGDIDGIKVQAQEILRTYSDVISPSRLLGPLDVIIDSGVFKGINDSAKKILDSIYNAFKDYTEKDEQAKILDLVNDIAGTGPMERYMLVSPFTGEILCNIYTPELKAFAIDLLKNLGGNISFDPLKFNIKRKTNSQSYKDAWNKAINLLDDAQFDDDILNQIQSTLKGNQV